MAVIASVESSWHTSYTPGGSCGQRDTGLWSSVRGGLDDETTEGGSAWASRRLSISASTGGRVDGAGVGV